MTTSGISHFAIKVRDLKAAEAFYCGVLGLAVAKRWPHPGGLGERSLWLETGDRVGTFLALEMADPAPPLSGPPEHGVAPTTNGGHHLLALRIEPAQRASFETRLAAAGITVSHRTAFTIYFADPEGNLLGLSHHPHPHPHPPPPAASPPGST